MPHLVLALLGPLQVTVDGRPATGFSSAKVRALLAYLAVEADQPHPRDSLTALLWPDWPDGHARNNLRQALANLRAVLGEASSSAPYLLISREMVQFNRASDHTLDVAAFERGTRARATGEGREEEAIERLAECVALYRGPFLEGFAVPDSAPLEQWLSLQREHWQREMLATLGRLAALHEGQGDYARALECARKAAALEPTNERCQRELMRLLALGGERSAALAQYEACRRTLAEELGIDPAPETTALYEQIRSGALRSAGPRPRIAASASPPVALEPAEGQAQAPRALFVARTTEMARLEGWLGEALAGQGRVGWVLGEPGSGKTTLLREFAYRAMEAHPALIVAGGTCSAYAGIGDPYLPFLELLRTLLGDVEARRAVGEISGEHARRLQAATSHALETVLETGPALVDTLLPGAMLLARARSLPDGAAWAPRIREALSNRMGAPSQAYLFDQLCGVLQALARARPLLLTLDDLQWADAASVSLLFHLGRRLAGHRILILAAYRPEEVAVGREGQPHPLQPVLLELGTLWEENEVDLAQAEGRAFVDALVDSEPNRLGSGFRESLYRQTGGQALFTVELWRGLKQRGDLVRDAAGPNADPTQGAWVEGAALDWGRLPKRVEAVIAAHIARLPREQQELLAAASVEGEEFHAEVAARVLQRHDQEVLRALSGPLGEEHRLVRAQSLRRVGELPSTAGSSPRMGCFSRYRFRHHLFQHYLYQRLDPVRRAHLHGAVAAALEDLGAVAPDSYDLEDTRAAMSDNNDGYFEAPEGIASEAQLAWHWEEAGLAEKAVGYQFRAAVRAYLFAAGGPEQVSQITRLVDMIAALPHSSRRLRYGYVAYIMLGWEWSRVTGMASGEVGQAFRQGLELAEQTEDSLLVADALVNLANHSCACGELEEAAALAERALSLAKGAPQEWVVAVQGVLAMILVYRGALAKAARLLAPHTETLLAPGSTLAMCRNGIQHLVLVPWLMWCLGYPDQALHVGRVALQMVLRDKGSCPVGQDANVLYSAICFTHRLRREVEGVARGLQMLQEGGRYLKFIPILLPMYQGWVHAQQGWTQAEPRLLEQGIAEMRQTLADRKDGVMLMPTLQKGFLAEALAHAGRVDEGLQMLAEALDLVERTGERFCEAELWRLRGELLLQRPLSPAQSPSSPALLPYKTWEKGGEEAEACFRRAIAVARGQEAKSWELRATTSLARLLSGQGRAGEAREMLAAIYGWFTEGSDTPDLVEAKRLLEELGG